MIVWFQLDTSASSGPNGTTIPWHGVSETLQVERDVVLVRHDRERMHRFRFNGFADAMCGAFLARHLTASRKRPPSRGLK